CILCVFFFFQAEDGIRDRNVTGVQTCALPILMFDIHYVRITAQTILNYANSVALITKPFVDHYPYELSDSFCGDETYIRVNGKRSEERRVGKECRDRWEPRRERRKSDELARRT